ncbi:hypothetical protein LINPERPRIM_LOCUS35821 [Linum perenne]
MRSPAAAVGGSGGLQGRRWEGVFPNGGDGRKWRWSSDVGLGEGFEVDIGGYEDAVEEFVREGVESVGGSSGRQRDLEKLEKFGAGLQGSLTKARGHTNPRPERHAEEEKEGR